MSWIGAFLIPSDEPDLFLCRVRGVEGRLESRGFQCRSLEVGAAVALDQMGLGEDRLKALKNVFYSHAKLESFI